MKNRLVGIIIVIFAALMGFMIWLFNRALSQIVDDSCSHGPTCPMWGSISFHTNLSIGIMVAVAILGLYFIFFVKEESEIRKEFKPRKIEKHEYTEVLKDLSEEERHVMNKLIDAQGSLFQSDLVDEAHTKVKVTRILDRLEGKNLIERKRRGMTNIVILRH